MPGKGRTLRSCFNIEKEIRFQDPDVEKFSYAMTIEMVMEANSRRVNRIPTFLIGFRDGLSASAGKKKNQTLEQWLRVRMSNKRIRAIPY